MLLSWLFYALSGYFLHGLASVGDKIILKKIIPHPASYAFWQGVLSLGALLLIPFGFYLLDPIKAALCFLAGALFIWGLFSFFWAVRRSDVSRVSPIVLSLTPLFLFIAEKFILNLQFSNKELFAAGLLIAGSLLLSADFIEEKRFFSHKIFLASVIAAVFMAASLFLMKSLFLSGDFINVYIWSRIGFFLGSLIFFILPSWRGEIFTSFSQLKKPSGGIYLILNKLLGAFGALAIYFAISKNTAALVSALQGFQFAIVFILVFLFSFFWPKIIKESFTSRELAEKLCGILLVSAGLYYLSFL